MKDDRASTGMDPMSAWLGWYGISGNRNGDIAAQFDRVQAFTAGVQNAYLEAFNRQMEMVSAANQRFAHFLQTITQAQEPQETMSTAFELVAAVVEGASEQSHTWINLTQKLQDCCAAMARDAAEDVQRQSGLPPASRTGPATAAPPTRRHGKPHAAT